MSKAPKRGPLGSEKPTNSMKSRVARHALAKRSSHKRAKAQNVKHIPKGRLEEATAKLDSQLAHVQALYAVRLSPIAIRIAVDLNGRQRPEVHAASKETPTHNSNVSVEGLGDILQGL